MNPPPGQISTAAPVFLTGSGRDTVMAGLSSLVVPVAPGAPSGQSSIVRKDGSAAIAAVAALRASRIVELDTNPNRHLVFMVYLTSGINRLSCLRPPERRARHPDSLRLPPAAAPVRSPVGRRLPGRP